MRILAFAIACSALAACSPSLGSSTTGLVTAGAGSGGTLGSAASGSGGTHGSSGTTAGPTTTGPTTSGPATSGPTTTGATTGSSGCPGYADPNTAAGCTCETGHTCGPNNCYGGYYCELSDDKCVAMPSNCQATTTTTGPTTTATATSTSSSSGNTTGTSGTPGTIGINGGTVSTLNFAVVGDTRPPTEGNSSDTQAENYPTAIITQIYQDVQAQNAQFVVATGDYQFASPSSNASAAQLPLYAQARANYTGVVFPAVGNHECDGATADSCDTSGNILSGGGTSNNYAEFKSTLLDPIQQTLPYYTININGTGGAWTSKFIFVACNFWDSTQQTWLQNQLSTSTTYTFVIVHEDDDASTLGPCQSASPTFDSILSSYHYTLRIAGHAHEYHWNSGVNEIVVGNGGAQLASASDQYGYAMITMSSPGGPLTINQIDYNSSTVVGTETVNP